jgi:hypothetical protein
LVRSSPATAKDHELAGDRTPVAARVTSNKKYLIIDKFVSTVQPAKNNRSPPSSRITFRDAISMFPKDAKRRRLNV